MARSGRYNGHGPLTDFKIIADDGPLLFTTDGSISFNRQTRDPKNPLLSRINSSRSNIPGEFRPFDVVNIETTSPSNLAKPGAFLRFSIEPAEFNHKLLSGDVKYETAAFSFRKQTLDPKFATSTRGASITEVPYNEGKGYWVRNYPWNQVGGLQLSSKGAQNDLILPYGIGSRDYYGFTITERGTTYINTGNGADAIIGGYGKDYFGSREREQLIALKQPKFSLKNTTQGAKFFVGGSGDDLLDGGNGEDLLVGDRFNGFELYLPTKALSNIPAEWKTTWQGQFDSIRKYQDPRYSDTTGAGHEILGNTRGNGGDLASGSTQYPLWIPGNDIIRGYDGNDIIYGDDSTMDFNLKQIVTIREWLSQTPPQVMESGGINSDLWNRDGFKLAADFIHGGAGQDQIFAGIGADAIIGGADPDVINLGPQIIADGYRPFFGPKVAYGDDAYFDEVTGKWQKDQSSASPDHFIIGRLVSSATDLSNSNSGELPALAIESKTMATQLARFETAWKEVSKVVKAIPKVGSIVTGIVDAAVKIVKLQDPKPTRPGNPAKARDAMTIIKDFDPMDMITFNVEDGQFATYQKGSISVAATEKDNPLIGDLGISSGARIMLADKAGTFYPRVYLEDVNELYVLARTPSEDGKSFAITLGGSAFAGALNEAGQPYQPVIF